MTNIILGLGLGFRDHNISIYFGPYTILPAKGVPRRLGLFATMEPAYPGVLAAIFFLENLF